MEIFILVFLISFAFLASLRPAWAIAFILATLPVYQIRFFVFEIPATLLEGMLLALAGVTLIKAFAHYQTYSAKLKLFLQGYPTLFWASILFIFSALIASAVSPELLKGLGIFKAYFAEGGIFFLLCIIHLDTKRKLFAALKGLGILIFYLSVFGVYQFFTLYRLPPAWWGPGLEPRRVVSFYTYPNAVALLIAPILAMFTALLALSQMGEERRETEGNLLSKNFLVGVNLAGVVLLFLTFSRGAWIGYAASTVLLLLFTKYKKPILTILAIGVLGLLLIPASRARLLPIFSGTDPAGLERLKLWRGAWEIIKINPITGAGLMGFREWYGALRQSSADEILNYPHNIFLNFWVETGLLGLAAVVAMLMGIGVKARELYRKHRQMRQLIIATLAAWVALIVHGQFDAPFFKNDLAILFWFLFATIPILTLAAGPSATAKTKPDSFS